MPNLVTHCLLLNMYIYNPVYVQAAKLEQCCLGHDYYMVMRDL